MRVYFSSFRLSDFDSGREITKQYEKDAWKTAEPQEIGSCGEPCLEEEAVKLQILIELEIKL